MRDNWFQTENEFVQWLQAMVARVQGRGRAQPKQALKLGIGDDAALVMVKTGHETHPDHRYVY